jgi:hypothetical protein
VVTAEVDQNEGIPRFLAVSIGKGGRVEDDAER